MDRDGTEHDGPLERDGADPPDGAEDAEADPSDASDESAEGVVVGRRSESSRHSRRSFLAYGGIAVLGAAAGGLIGYQVGTPAGKSSTRERVVRVGAIVPRRPPFLGQGQELVRGLDVGVKEVNDRKGIGGVPVELVVREVPGLDEAGMIAAANGLVSEEVLAVFLPFTSASCEELTILSEYGAPVFHLSTAAQSAILAEGGELANVYRCVPNPAGYGKRFAAILARAVSAGIVGPQARSATLVVADDAEGAALGTSVGAAVEQLDWTVVQETVTSPVQDWAPTLETIRQAAPGAIFLGLTSPEDLASFQQAFVEDPVPSLVFATQGPSVPEYTDLAAESADGVIWSTPIGTIQDDISLPFRELYERKYKRRPGLSQAGAAYDLVLMWAQAAGAAKRPTKFSSMGKIVPQLLYRGVSGTFNLRGEDRIALGFPSDTKDPAAGLPHLTFQIQDGRQVCLGPPPYQDGTLQSPPWVATT